MEALTPDSTAAGNRVLVLGRVLVLVTSLEFSPFVSLV